MAEIRPNQPPKKGELKIKIKDEELKGSYSNLMQISHTKEEFILDFFLVSLPQGILTSRIIMGPGHIKRMTRALQDNLSRYEDKFGLIEEAPTSEGELGFKAQD